MMNRSGQTTAKSSPSSWRIGAHQHQGIAKDFEAAPDKGDRGAEWNRLSQKLTSLRVRVDVC